METKETINEQTAQKTVNNNSELGFSAEDTLRVIAKIILYAGIVMSFVLLFTISFPSEAESIKFNLIGFATTLSVLFGSLILWATLTVLSNISTSLKKINFKIKQS
jgi:hypothetical protein